MDDVAQFVMLAAREESALWDLLSDPVYPHDEHDTNKRRSECTRAIRELDDRGWITASRVSGWPPITTAPIERQELDEVLGISVLWEWPQNQSAPSPTPGEFRWVRLSLTDAGERARDAGAARRAYDRMHEQMDRGRPSG